MTAEGAQVLQEMRIEGLRQWRDAVVASGIVVTPEMEAFLREATPHLAQLTLQSYLTGYQQGMQVVIDLVTQHAALTNDPELALFALRLPEFRDALMGDFTGAFGVEPYGKVARHV